MFVYVLECKKPNGINLGTKLTFSFRATLKKIFSANIPGHEIFQTQMTELSWLQEEWWNWQ